MPRTARLTDALRGRRAALAALGAAAALAGAGTASAATLTTAATAGDPAAHHAAGRRPPRHPHPRGARTQGRGPYRRGTQQRSPQERGPRGRGPGRRRRARPRPPYQIYDSVTPAAIPAHHTIATYATGGYAVSPAAVTGRHVLWIDTNGSDPRAAILDIEPGDATPAGAAAWTRAKLTAHPAALARLYTMRSEWPAVQAAVRTLPRHMQTRVRWWIADPTGTPHIVPGAQATQWYWGSHYDITTATPAF